MEENLSSSTTSPRGARPSYPKRIKLKRSKQITLPTMADRMQKFKTTDSRALHINKLVAEMICLDIQPLSVVENKGFRRLLNYLEPRYTIPTRKTFTNKILVEMYEETMKKVQAEMMEVESVAITTDMWTNVAQVDFMAITAHFFSNNARFHRCLEVVPFPEVSHTGTNLLTFLIKVLDQWSIKQKVVAVVRDNGPDITCALNLSEFTAIPCVAHTLQLVIKDGFFNNARISNVVTKCKKIVGSFKHSAKNTKLLKSYQAQLGVPSHKLIQDEPTRWNSTFYMLKRLHEQKQALILVGSNPETKLSTEITNEDWKTIEYAVDILEIFENATLQLSKETSTISEIIPMIHTIQHVLETRAPQGSGLQGLKNDLLASLKRRFMDMEENRTYACATLLDPRFKSTPFKKKDNFEMAKIHVLEEMKTFSTPTSEAAPPPAPQEDTQLKRKGFWAQYMEAFGQEEHTGDGDQEKSLESEVNAYLNEKTFDPKQGQKIAEYWSVSSHKHLRKLAYKYLCMPPCTTFSERLFSVAGNISDTKRNRLDPDRVKMLVFLNRNLE
ncbi:zinc finger BED domain-containing protein 4-like [Macrosteles quadrilineatus]|uniref:zinc finger BED domain-containing protein 4-like n=2 Tax=Macrosteles quadrilineatus TaxID=74068 RepID=UPI0023E32FDF|nr:zinc finger BED domain-containing protein 4-like [Macrosteles quadrilineatus]